MAASSLIPLRRHYIQNTSGCCHMILGDKWLEINYSLAILLYLPRLHLNCPRSRHYVSSLVFKIFIWKRCRKLWIVINKLQCLLFMVISVTQIHMAKIAIDNRSCMIIIIIFLFLLFRSKNSCALNDIVGSWWVLGRSSIKSIESFLRASHL